MSLTARVLVALVAGFLVGFAVASGRVPGGAAIVAILAPIGIIFLNLIRMTVVPLVASMLVASVGSLAASGALARVGARAAAFAVGLVTAVAAIAVAVAAPALAMIPIDREAAIALRPAASAADASASAAPAIAQWFVDLVPANVVKAAADGAMLPVIIFSVLFAFALAGVSADRRDAALRAVQAVADAMQRLVGWILELAPFGVFALAVPLASRLGLAAAGAVAAYIVVVVSLTIAVGVAILYPLGIVLGGMRPREFVAYCAPSQAVAFASRSSLAALPAMVESAERAGLPPVVSGFILPLAASVFRVGGAVAIPVGALFLARLYAVPVTIGQMASIVFTSALASFTVPGIPGGSIIAMVPVLAAAHLPIEGIGILLAVDAVPDMFRTTENATGSMMLAAVFGRGRLRKHSY